MGDPYHLVYQDAVAPPELPEVGVKVPNYQPPDDDWVPPTPPGAGSPSDTVKPPPSASPLEKEAAPTPPPPAEKTAAPPPPAATSFSPPPPAAPKAAPPAPAPPAPAPPAPAPPAPPKEEKKPEPVKSEPPKPSPPPPPPPKEEKKEPPPKEAAPPPPPAVKSSSSSSSSPAPPPPAAPKPKEEAAPLSPDAKPAVPPQPSPQAVPEQQQLSGSFAQSPLTPGMMQMPAFPMYAPPQQAGGGVSMETVVSLRSELERADRRLEDTVRSASDDRRGLQSQIDSLQDELRRERDSRIAHAAEEMKSKLKEVEECKVTMERQFKQQVEASQELQRKLAEREAEARKEVEVLREKLRAEAEERRDANMRGDRSEDRAATERQRGEELRRRFEVELERERQEYEYKNDLLRERMEMQHRIDIIDINRREQAEREWEESAEWKDFSELKKQERRDVAGIAERAARRRGAEQEARLGRHTRPPTVADVAFDALVHQGQHQARQQGGVYTTRSFGKVYDILTRLDLQAYAPVFAANEFDESCLASLTESDLDQLGISTLGARKRLLAESERLQRRGVGGGQTAVESFAKEEKQRVLDEEVTAEWAKERMAHINRVCNDDEFKEVLAWDEAWREASVLDASDVPCDVPGGHKAAVLLKRLSSPSRVVAVQPPPPPSPPPLSPRNPWTTYYTHEGVAYYHNIATGETRWTLS